ncbi:hypothetical protein SeLEV6574_g04344 [Synchytrium endobioticum]|nr:hypothetical protein SeLEV6574_g04344 [Synchytrium endobioticum]
MKALLLATLLTALCLPRTSATELVYTGGQLSTGDIAFHVIYVNYSPSPAFTRNISNFLADMPAIEPFFAVMNEYLPAAGSLLTGVACVSSTEWTAPSTNLTEPAVQAYIAGLGMSFTPSDVLLFMLAPDTQMAIVDNGRTAMSCREWCGVHLVAGSKNNFVPYAVIPSFGSQCKKCSAPGLPKTGNPVWDLTTFVIHHEAAELFTDTYENATPALGAGFVNKGNGPGDKQAGLEIGDLCQDFSYTSAGNEATGGRKYFLSKLWSNKANKCVP